MLVQLLQLDLSFSYGAVQPMAWTKAENVLKVGGFVVVKYEHFPLDFEKNRKINLNFIQ
jgi:hypothetical protein